MGIKLALEFRSRKRERIKYDCNLYSIKYTEFFLMPLINNLIWISESIFRKPGVIFKREKKMKKNITLNTFPCYITRNQYFLPNSENIKGILSYKYFFFFLSQFKHGLITKICVHLQDTSQKTMLHKLHVLVRFE